MISKSAKVLGLVAAERGLDIDAKRLQQAVAVHERIGKRLRDLRSIRLSYVGEVIEPATAQQWVRNGGSSNG